MSPTGLARETQLAAVEGSAPHRVPERAEALLGAIEWLQQARDPAELCQCAALAVLDALCEGVLIAVDGRVKLLNRAAAQIFSADRDASQGSAVEVMWPELARLLEEGAQLDAEPLRVGGKDLLVTLRNIRDGRRPTAAVISFTERKACEARIRPRPAHALLGFEDLIGGSA